MYTVLAFSVLTKPSLYYKAGPAEGGVPGVHVHPLFLGETLKNLPKHSLSSMPFVHRAPPVFGTLRRACSTMSV